MQYILKEMVGRGKKVRFVRFRKNELIYITDCGMEFPVPTDPTEVGDGVFLAEDKAMMFMRYIRKHIKNIQKGLSAQAV